MRNTDPNGYWASAQARSVEGWRSRARVAESKLDAVERHKRLKAARVEAEAFDEIARLASELRKTGVEMSMLIRTIKRFDRSERKAKPITRQNLNVMISNHETRQRPKARRRRDAEPGGGVNLEVLQ
jgi:hypothetical protein